MPLKSLTPYFTFWRRWMAADREVVDAVVAPEHRGPSAGLAEALRGWPGTHYWAGRRDGDRLVLIRSRGKPARERWGLHLALFVLTFLTVWTAGAGMADVPFRFRRLLTLNLQEMGTEISMWLSGAPAGLPFAIALMAILLVHELGHYVLARRYFINASLPYFIPAPYQFNFIGTFGAFIRLRSPIVDRRQLFDVGVAGPWAGLVVSIAVLYFGLANSTVMPDVPSSSDQFIYYLGMRIDIGDSLLMRWMRMAVVGEGPVLLHPLAVAGWCGVFVTMLNLIPLGQLDGGHVVYALIGKHQAKVGLLMWLALIPLGQLFWGWWLWAFLILLLGRGRVAHPDVMDPHPGVPRSRWIVGIATAGVFVLTFTPDPFRFFG